MNAHLAREFSESRAKVLLAGWNRTGKAKRSVLVDNALKTMAEPKSKPTKMESGICGKNLLLI
jgi:hypothetical protein